MADQPHVLPLPIWLDCDTGHDDALAILLAAQYHSINLLGISTIYGNASLANTTYNSRAILKAINREDVPVYTGASKPFCRAIVAAPDIHGESGLDGTTCLPTPIVPARTDVVAVEAIYQALIAQPPNTAYLVATGACTNIALLFAVHPELAEHIAGLSIMGGAIGGGFSDAPMGVVQGEGERFGNWTPFAEFNIYIDPESASSIFSNEVLARKTTLIPLDLTHQFLATEEVQQGLLYGFDALSKNKKIQKTSQASQASQEEDIPNTNPTNPNSSNVRKLFHEILTFFAKTYAEVFGLDQGPPTHDPLAVAAILVPHAFHDGGGERFAIKVVTEGAHGSCDHIRSSGSQCGRTIAKLLPRAEEGVRIPRSLDKEVLWRLLEGCLSRVEGACERGDCFLRT